MPWESLHRPRLRLMGTLPVIDCAGWTGPARRTSAVGEVMQPGKLPHNLLRDLLGAIEGGDAQVIIGPQVGVDAAVVDIGDQLLVAASDPVTLADDQAGWYAVHVNANDVATMGATPRWFLATILLPANADPGMAHDLFQQVLTGCRELGVTLIGGHTEVTPGIEKPIVAGCMLGVVEKGNVVTSSGALPGDSIVVTKGIAIEGSALLARRLLQRGSTRGIDAATLADADRFLAAPGISVVRDSMVARASGRVHSMHDVTEGGLATALHEVAQSAGVGLVIEEGSVPVLPQCIALCQATGLDPLGLLASGCLIITLPPEDVPAVMLALEVEGIDAYEIGQVTEAEEGVKMIGASHELMDLPVFERDELARFIEESP